VIPTDGEAKADSSPERAPSVAERIAATALYSRYTLTPCYKSSRNASTQTATLLNFDGFNMSEARAALLDLPKLKTVVFNKRSLDTFPQEHREAYLRGGLEA
jgi:hypothetical protein